MNVPYFCCGDNFIDATNSFITGSGGGGSGDISGGSSGDTLNNYIYLLNSNLYINNSNLDGEIRIKVRNNNNNPTYSQDHRVKVNKDGKLQLYHVYNPLIPTYGSGWYDISDEIVGLKFNADLQQIEITANGAAVLVIEGQISDIYATLTTILTALGNTNNSIELTQDLLYDNNVLNTNHGNLMKFRDNYNILMEDFVGNSLANGVRQRAIENRSFITNSIANITGVYGLGLQIGVPVVAGLIGAFYSLQEDRNVYNKASNLSNVNFEITPTQRRQLLDSNLITSVSNMVVLASNLSNLSVGQGFINSNIITTQTIPSLKSNKIMLGNIITPNSSYQMEMTGDLNLNQLYINSTSLTSLLNQKQNNITAVSPLYLTTGNLGLNYDSSLTKIGNNLSVVKTATAPLNWTGNDIALSFDSTLLNNAGSLGVSIAAESKWSFSGANIYNKALTNVGIGTNSGLKSKLNVIGDIYCSSNINIGTSNLPDFNGSFFNVAVNGITTDDEKERYLLYLVDGSLTLNEPTAADIFMVGAGGYGGTGAGSGGGGAGEVIYYPNFPLPKATVTIQVGYVDPNSSLRRSRIYIPSGNTIMTALGGGDGGTSNFYSTSGSGIVSALTPIAGTNDAYLSFTSNTTTFTLSANCSADILIVGGGGGGGGDMGGGGGGGGVVYQTNVSLSSGSYSITVGAGGNGAPEGGVNQGSITFNSVDGTAGNDSKIQFGGSDLIIGGITYVGKGGGGGGNYDAGGTYNGTSGTSGGSGGGAGAGYSGTSGGGSATQGNTYYNGSTNVAGGYAGSQRIGFQISGAYIGGGGGGAGGSPTSGSQNGNPGIQVNITGTNSWYASGGGAGVIKPTAGSTLLGGVGGNGIGGDGNLGLQSGAVVTIATKPNGTANTGAGGGGGVMYYNTGTKANGGGNGGSGIVIIRFKNYLTIMAPTSGGSGGGGAKNQTGAAAGVKFDDYKSFSLAGLNGTSTTGGNGGSGSSLYNTRYICNITGTPISVGLGGSGVGNSPPTPATKANYGDGGDGNGGSGFKGVVIIRFKKASTNLHLKAIKDNANAGLILNANESLPYQLRIFPWSDTYTATSIPTRGWSFRCHDGAANLDLINLFSFFGGRVGIKTKNPGAVLDVNGDIQCKTFIIQGNEQYGITCQVTNQHATGEASMNVFAGQAGTYGGLSVVYLPSQTLGYISCSKNLRIKTGNDAANSYIHIDDSSGNVGIGMNNPSYKLVVNGTIGANDIMVSGSINATTLGIGQIYATGIDNSYFNNLQGSIVNNKFLYSSNIYVNNFIDCQNKPIYNCSYLYGTADIAKEWKAVTNYYHKDDQGRERIYFKNDTTGSPPNHFTLFKSGSYTHSFADKDDTQYAILDRFGLTTYFEVISGSGYDNVGVLDGVSTGTYVFRKMYLRLSTFTEVHRCFCEDELYNNYNDFINNYIGRIVISKGKIKTALKEPEKEWEILEGKNGITIDDSHPIVELSRKKNDKRVIGVITKRESNKDMENRLVINSLGETSVWIVNSNGNIQNGDLITTSDQIGYGQLQLDSNGEVDEIIRNFTLGKSMIDCDFQLDSNEYKCEIIDETRDLRRAFLPIFVYSG